MTSFLWFWFLVFFCFFQVFEESLAASRKELKELEEVGQSLHDGSTGDASLTTQVREGTCGCLESTMSVFEQ